MYGRLTLEMADMIINHSYSSDPMVEDYLVLSRITQIHFYYPKNSQLFHFFSEARSPKLFEPAGPPISVFYYPIILIKSLYVGIHHLSIIPIFMWCSGASLSLLPILIRLSIMIIFVGSFFLRPLQNPIMIVWARVIESDKPVFILLFGGTAALAKAIQEIWKIL